MNAYTRSLMAIAALSVMPLTSSFAQSTQSNPLATAGKGSVAGPSYPARQDTNPALDPKLRGQAMNVPASENPRVPGATGNVVVPGNNSTIMSDRAGTIDEKTGTRDQGTQGGNN